MAKRKRPGASAVSALESTMARVYGKCHLSATAMTGVLGLLQRLAPELGAPGTMKQFTEGAGFTSDHFNKRVVIRSYCPACGVHQEMPETEAAQLAADEAKVCAPFAVACTRSGCSGQPWTAFEVASELQFTPTNFDVCLHPEYQLWDMMQSKEFWQSYAKQDARLAERHEEWAAERAGGPKVTVNKDWMNGCARDWFEKHGQHVSREKFELRDGAHCYMHCRRLADCMTAQTCVATNRGVKTLNGSCLEFLSLTKTARTSRQFQVIEQVSGDGSKPQNIPERQKWGLQNYLRSYKKEGGFPVDVPASVAAASGCTAAATMPAGATIRVWCHIVLHWVCADGPQMVSSSQAHSDTDTNRAPCVAQEPEEKTMGNKNPNWILGITGEELQAHEVTGMTKKGKAYKYMTYPQTLNKNPKRRGAAAMTAAAQSVQDGAADCREHGVHGVSTYAALPWYDIFDFKQLCFQHILKGAPMHREIALIPTPALLHLVCGSVGTDP